MPPTRHFDGRRQSGTRRAEGGELNDLTLRIYVWLRTLMVCEEAQDLVEYALLCALIACGVTMGMKDLAFGIDHAFDRIAFSVRQSASSGAGD